MKTFDLKILNEYTLEELEVLHVPEREADKMMTVITHLCKGTKNRAIMFDDEGHTVERCNFHYSDEDWDDDADWWE